MRRAWIAAAFVVACIGCASLIGIPNDTPSWCASHPGHSYCEDFDIGDPSTRWTYATTQNGASWALAPSDASPPNLIALTAPGVPEDAGIALAGFDKEFVEAGFGGLHIEADMRIANGDAGLRGETGILLITDKLGGCLAVAATAEGIGVEALQTADLCSMLTSSHSSGPPSDGATMPPGDSGAVIPNMPIGQLPQQPNVWFHMTVDVDQDPTGKTGGTLTMDISGVPSGYMPVTIPKGTLPENGDPLVGFSSSPLPGTPATRVEFDNVTIDVKSP